MKTAANFIPSPNSNNSERTTSQGHPLVPLDTQVPHKELRSPNVERKKTKRCKFYLSFLEHKCFYGQRMS